MSASPYLSVKDAARELGISEDGVRKLIKRGRLKALKRSERNIVIPRPAFAAYTRRLNGEQVAPLGLATPVGSLHERLAEFAAETGYRPKEWLGMWLNDDDPTHDTVTNMQFAVSATALVAEQRAGSSSAAVAAQVSVGAAVVAPA